jgi:hypothetical protein
VPRVAALDQLRQTPRRVREHPWIAVAVVAGGLLLCAWIAWAIVVTDDHGARAGLGVLVAWPVIVIAVAILSLPFVGGYFLVRRLSGERDVDAPEEPESDSDPEREPEAAAN